MTAADWYLFCFVVGFALSVLSFLMGNFHIHLPHFGPHVHVGHVHAGHAGGAHSTGHAHGTDLPAINFGTVTAFLAWFGGVGFLLTRYSGLYVVPIVVLSTMAGLFGATLVFLFVAKVLLKHERDLDPADYERVGVLGRISSSIREQGTGEIVFSQEGTRHTCGARSEDGRALAKGTEVVITKYEKGIAYVSPWEEISNASDSDLQQETSK
jgi:membrane protein implicated in regulation of membrane protease activity